MDLMVLNISQKCALATKMITKSRVVLSDIIAIGQMILLYSALAKPQLEYVVQLMMICRKRDT